MALDFSFEKKLKRSGCRVIIGLDEVGRGPLAGPVTACAVMIPEGLKFRVSGLKDSKKLTPKKREGFCYFFTKELKIHWAVASVSPKVIDCVNIFEATKLAAKRAVLKLEKKIRKTSDLIIIDGNATLNLAREQMAIVKGDEKISVCAIASIIAKVKRDCMMLRYHKKYPEYRFDLHKGYGTKLHFQMIKKYRLSPIHRVSFRLF